MGTPSVLDEQRRMLRDSAQAFVDDRMPVAQLRALRDRADERGYVAACWRGFGGGRIESFWQQSAAAGLCN
jgi:hypothetical protein